MANSKSLITHLKPKDLASEAYRMLRTNLHYLNIDKTNKTIVVTSPSKAEGKTTTAANLAITYAQMNKKTILVGCDLRKPRVCKLFDIDNLIGVTNIIIEKIPFEDAIVNCKKIPNLFILPSGAVPPNPAELLQSNSMKELLEELKAEYDIILIDVPPVCLVADGILLSAMVDGVILVIASGETKKDAAKLAVKSLNKVGANILGTVLSKVKLSNKRYYNSYYSN